MLMKNIIPFKHEIIFKTNINEITSISLENTLSIENDKLCGDFIISGDYKETAESDSKVFDIKLPFSTVIDGYDTRNASIDIDDFYYEIKNNNVLFISIDILIDKLEEKIIKEDRIDIEEEKEEERVDTSIITEVFNEPTFYEDSYVEYNVYILRDGDTIDTILDKYNTTIEDLKKYNNLDDLKIGDKIIIPNE